MNINITSAVLCALLLINLFYTHFPQRQILSLRNFYSQKAFLFNHPPQESIGNLCPPDTTTPTTSCHWPSKLSALGVVSNHLQDTWLPIPVLLRYSSFLLLLSKNKYVTYCITNSEKDVLQFAQSEGTSFLSYPNQVITG